VIFTQREHGIIRSHLAHSTFAVSSSFIRRAFVPGAMSDLENAREVVPPLPHCGKVDKPTLQHQNHNRRCMAFVSAIVCVFGAAVAVVAVMVLYFSTHSKEVVQGWPANATNASDMLHGSSTTQAVPMADFFQRWFANVTNARGMDQGASRKAVLFPANFMVYDATATDEVEVIQNVSGIVIQRDHMQMIVTAHSITYRLPNHVMFMEMRTMSGQDVLPVFDRSASSLQSTYRFVDKASQIIYSDTGPLQGVYENITLAPNNMSTQENVTFEVLQTNTSFEIQSGGLFGSRMDLLSTQPVVLDALPDFHFPVGLEIRNMDTTNLNSSMMLDKFAFAPAIHSHTQKNLEVLFASLVQKQDAASQGILDLLRTLGNSTDGELGRRLALSRNQIIGVGLVAAGGMMATAGFVGEFGSGGAATPVLPVIEASAAETAAAGAARLGMADAATIGARSGFAYVEDAAAAAARRAANMRAAVGYSQQFVDRALKSEIRSVATPLLCYGGQFMWEQDGTKMNPWMQGACATADALNTFGTAKSLYNMRGLPLQPMESIWQRGLNGPSRARLIHGFALLPSIGDGISRSFAGFGGRRRRRR